MSDSIETTATSPDGRERVVIVRRPDGCYSFRRQSRRQRHAKLYFLLDCIARRDNFMPEQGWTLPGPRVGIYDSRETAEREAIDQIDWLSAFPSSY